ncbi:MAG: glycerophosphodiester phosphodiesterase, partial [Phenylobacterium sp.]|nr:glycerophosphodiester phosphodiesterase [Phenylobacterium sp.]
APMAYRLAVDQGCDFIEPDLVLTKDGVLVVRHENEIGGTTDVAARPEFAARRTSKIVDGETLEGWFAEDFTLAELKTLRARERLPALRPVSAAFDGREAIPTFQEVLDLAKTESQRVGRVIGVYPEMKHPTFLASQGLPIEQRLADALKTNGLNSRTAPVFVQCFETAPLKAFAKLSSARRVRLVGGDAKDLVTASGLKEMATYADGVGPDWSLVIPTVGGALAPATTLVADAHRVGLAVHPWTVRAENRFLPETLRRGTDMAAHGDVAAVFAALYAAGVDGLFSDFPGLAVKARG